MEPVRNFSLTPDQVSLRLFEQCVISEIYVNVGQRENRGKAKARLPLQSSHVHVVIVPWHTFPFRQNTAAQAEQRGETDPLQKAGCHRVFWSSWREGVIPYQQRAIFRCMETLEILKFFFFLLKLKKKKTFPSLGNFDSSSSSQISPVVRVYGARGHTTGCSDVSRAGREDRCASQTAQVEESQWMI